LRYKAKLVYIHSDSPNNVRVSKCLQVFAGLFDEVHYIGCVRTGTWNDSEGISGVKYHIDRRTARRGIRGLATSLRFTGFVKENLRKISPDVVVATNEDYVLPFMVGYCKRPPVLICDLIDSLSIRTVDALRYLNPLWSLLSRSALHSVDGLVEVTDERLARHKKIPKHHVVIFNSPPAMPLTPRANLPKNFIYVCGSILDDVSGVEALLAACEKVEGASIVFAGRPIGPWMTNSFLKHPLVTNLGETTPRGSMEIAAAATAMFAHYKPFVENHIYAAPNKLFDAMMVGIPLLINSECLVSEFAQKTGFGIPTRFGNIEELESAIRSVYAPDERLIAGCRHAQALFETQYSWQHMEERWTVFFDGFLGVKNEERTFVDIS
jgi:glycosyltransferase involved in cell wall biosynthesis